MGRARLARLAQLTCFGEMAYGKCLALRPRGVQSKLSAFNWTVSGPIMPVSIRPEMCPGCGELHLGAGGLAAGLHLLVAGVSAAPGLAAEVSQVSWLGIGRVSG